jgi:copper chaperone CopZ
MPTERLRLEGELDCAKVIALRKTLGQVWGIQRVDVDPVRSEVSFSWDERASSLGDFRQAIESQGFRIRRGM